MKNMKGKVFGFACVLFFVSLFVVVQTSSAEINFEKFTGQVKITAPDGTVTILEPGQKPPGIESGSTIEVISGSAEISVLGVPISLEAGSEIKVDVECLKRCEIRISCLKGKAEVLVGLARVELDIEDEILIRINRKTGLGEISILSGEVNLYVEGVKKVMKPGDRYKTEIMQLPCPIPSVPEPQEPEPIEASPYLPD